MQSATDANRDPFLTCSCTTTLWHPWIPPYLLMHTYLVYSSHPHTIQSSTACPQLSPEPSVAQPAPLKQRTECRGCEKPP